MNNDVRLEEIKARFKKIATPWKPDDCEIQVDPEDGYILAPQGATLGDTLISLGDTYDGSGDDWNFVAHAVEDVKFLLTLIEAYESEIQHHGDGIPG